jgi:hypothetical protein
LLKSLRAGFVNVLNHAVKKKCAFRIGVPFQDRHHEDESLEVFEAQDTTKFEIASGSQSELVNGSVSGAGNAWARLQRVDCVLNNRSLRP